MSINYDIDEYLNNEEIVPLEILTIIIESKFNRTLADLKNLINNCGVKLTRTEIESFLTEKHKEKQHINPYTLKFFKRYINCLISRINGFIILIEKISNLDLKNINETLKSLDITIIDEEFISTDDVRRIIYPTIYSILELFMKDKLANTKETYLTFKDPLNTCIRLNRPEIDLYPSTKLQIPYITKRPIPGHIPLSENQINEITNNKAEEGWAKIIFKNMAPNEPPADSRKKVYKH